MWIIALPLPRKPWATDSLVELLRNAGSENLPVASMESSTPCGRLVPRSVSPVYVEELGQAFGHGLAVGLELRPGGRAVRDLGRDVAEVGVEAVVAGARVEVDRLELALGSAHRCPRAPSGRRTSRRGPHPPWSARARAWRSRTSRVAARSRRSPPGPCDGGHDRAGELDQVLEDPDDLRRRVGDFGGLGRLGGPSPMPSVKNPTIAPPRLDRDGPLDEALELVLDLVVVLVDGRRVVRCRRCRRR